MALTCTRCGKNDDAPPAHRIGFSAPAKQKILSSICAACWKEWEGMEIKVINEYRLNLFEPEHRQMIERACLEFLGLSLEA